MYAPGVDRSTPTATNLSPTIGQKQSPDIAMGGGLSLDARDPEAVPELEHCKHAPTCQKIELQYTSQRQIARGLLVASSVASGAATITILMP
eukprot:COSAG02_NODE_1403_length_12811_cov_8.982536_10_plen_92_part_00